MSKTPGLAFGLLCRLIGDKIGNYFRNNIITSNTNDNPLKPCNIFIFGDQKKEKGNRKEEIGGLEFLIFHLIPYCSFLLPFFYLLFFLK